MPTAQTVPEKPDSNSEYLQISPNVTQDTERRKTLEARCYIYETRHTEWTVRPSADSLILLEDPCICNFRAFPPQRGAKHRAARANPRANVSANEST